MCACVFVQIQHFYPPTKFTTFTKPAPRSWWLQQDRTVHQVPQHRWAVFCSGAGPRGDRRPGLGGVGRRILLSEKIKTETYIN